MEKLARCDYFYSTEIDPMEYILKEMSMAGKISKKNRKIVIVVPPSPQQPTPGREFLITGPFEGITYIGSLISKMGYGVNIVDCRLKENPVNLVIDNIKEADIVCIGAYCDSFEFLCDLTEVIKKIYSDKLIILGGPLVSALPEIILRSTSADCAVIGEAELTILELFDHYLEKKSYNFNGIKGLAYKDGDKVIINPMRPQIKNLDYLPFPDFSLWQNYESILKNRQILISSMRGCPQECSFCFKTMPATRYKSIEHFEEEVKYLKKTTGFNYTWLNDLTFNVKSERAIKITQVLKKYNINYHVFARVRNVTKELTDKLKETGCLGIWYGIESVDQEILNCNRKNTTFDQTKNAITLALDSGLAVRGLFIVGLYGETIESLEAMYTFIKQSRFLPLVKYLVPFPGTGTYNYALKTGKIKDEVEFLRLLSRRTVGDTDDEIINITDLEECTLRDYYHKIWKITHERKEEDCYKK